MLYQLGLKKMAKSPNNLETIAGFFDGDGSVYTASQSGGTCMSITFMQCDYNILLRYRELFGGRLWKRVPVNTNHRTQYSLRLSGWDAYDVLVKLRPYLRVKAYAADLAMKFMTDFYRTPDCAEKQELIRALAAENATEQRTVISRGSITAAYIAGILDAEGCCMLRSIQIAQKQDITVLEEIERFFGFGTVTNKVWYACGPRKMHTVLVAVLPYLDVKRKQADIILRCFDGDMSDMQKVTTLKHVNFDLPDEEIERLNAEQVDSRKADTRNDESHALRSAANQAARKRQSDRGPVYAGPRTTDIVGKAVTSMYANDTTRRKVTDEQIIEVKRRLEAGEVANAVARDMGLHSAQVYKIRDGTLLPMQELLAAPDPVALNAAARAAAPEKTQSDITLARKTASRILGGNNNRALTDEQIIAIRKAIDAGQQLKRIAEELGISAALVSKVKSGALKTVAEVREDARAAGVYVDAVFSVAEVNGKTVTKKYDDVWKAAAETQVVALQIFKHLDTPTPTGGYLWKTK